MTRTSLGTILALFVACTPITSETAEADAVAPKYADPSWAVGMRMVDLELHDGYPASADQIDNDLVGLRARVAQAKAAGASVVQIHFSDEFLYADWVDDAGFEKNVQTLSAVMTEVHAQGMHGIVYMNGLEVMSPGVNPSRKPQAFDATKPSIRRDHPDWLAEAPDGSPIWFSGLDGEDADYIHGADWEDAWMCPLSGWRTFFLSRVDDVVRRGDADGVFVDVAFLPGLPELVPRAMKEPDRFEGIGGCFDTRCRERFASSHDGHDPDDDGTGWIRFRYTLPRDFYAEIDAHVKAAKPDGLTLAETSANDVPESAISFGNDNTQSPIGVTPEIAPPMGDESEACDSSRATRYADFLAMLEFGRAINAANGRAYVPLASVVGDEDAWIQSALATSTAGAFFTFGRSLTELAGPFAMLAAHGDLLARPTPAARVAVLYSQETRDLVDRATGTQYDPGASKHFRSYRAALRGLADSHVPYTVLFAETASDEALSAFDAIVVPGIAAMSRATAERLERAAARGAQVLVADEVATLDTDGKPEAKTIPGATAVDVTQVASALGRGGELVTIEGHGLASNEPILVGAGRARADGALLVTLVRLPAGVGCSDPPAPARGDVIVRVAASDVSGIDLIAHDDPARVEHLAFEARGDSHVDVRVPLGRAALLVVRSAR